MKKFALTLVATLLMGTAALANPVKVGVAAEPYPPFTSPDASGNWVGWEVDFMNALCAKAEIECGPLRLDTKTARVTVAGELVRLTSHEYRLLAYLLHHGDRVVSRTELVEHLYEQDFDRDSNTIEVFIGRLRKKLGAERIETVRGLGYRLAALEGEA